MKSNIGLKGSGGEQRCVHGFHTLFHIIVRDVIAAV